MASAIHIVVCGPPLDRIGGVSRFLSAVLPNLSFDVTYWAVGSGGLPSSSGTLRRLALDARRVARYARAAYDLRSLSERPIVLVNPSLDGRALLRDGLLCLVAQAAGCRTLAFVHGWNTRVAGRIERLVPRSLLRQCVSMPDSVVVLSSAFRDQIRGWGRRGPIHILSTAIDDDCSEAAKASTEHGAATEGPRRLLFLGRVVKAKGVESCIRALPLIQRVHPHASLMIAGDGPDLEAMKDVARELELTSVTFTGPVTGRARVAAFGDAQVMLLPSHGEGMPTAVLEGLAFGLTPVVTVVGGVSDMVGHGVPVVPLRNARPETVADAVIGLLSDPVRWGELGRQGRRIALQLFTAEAVAKRLEEVISLAYARNSREITWFGTL